MMPVNPMSDVRDFAELWRPGACRNALRDALDFVECIDQFVNVHFKSLDLRIIEGPVPATSHSGRATPVALSGFVASAI